MSVSYDEIEAEIMLSTSVERKLESLFDGHSCTVVAELATLILDMAASEAASIPVTAHSGLFQCGVAEGLLQAGNILNDRCAALANTSRENRRG